MPQPVGPKFQWLPVVRKSCPVIKNTAVVIEIIF
jgi:hypothetical protein